MGLVDRACDRFFDMARERWRKQGFDASIIDILDKYREETNKVIKRNKVRGTYRCYNLVEDGNQKLRKEKSDILDDNCCIYGIRDWVLDFITLEVFKYLECDINSIKKRLIETIERAFVSENECGYSETDVLKFNKEIENLKNRNERLLDGFEDGIYSKEKYLERKNKNDTEITRLQELIDSAYDTFLAEQDKEQTLSAVYKFVDEALVFPRINGTKFKVPDALIETYVNSIKACKDNNYEFNIRVNPEAPIQVPIKPDEEFNPQRDSAKLILNNQNAVLIGEFKLTYEDAKSYTSATNGRYKVKKDRFEKPVSVRIYASI